MKEFKFKEDLAEVDKLGVCCPPEDLIEIDEFKVFRFTFDPPNEHKNHIVAAKKNPQRVLKTSGEKKCRLFGLSCFKDDQKAIHFFEEIKKNNPMIKKSLGDSLSSGILSRNDGMITLEDEWTHFDFFQYEDCDLTLRFIPLTPLP